tara:strand:+ start:327 stop:488 length:162 start_codon:yes stop_codon:yes gene_type:complete
MKHPTHELQGLRFKAEVRNTNANTAQLKQVLAQIEAAVSRKENQKVSEKSKKI